MSKTVRIPLIPLTVKTETFFILIIIKELIINAPLVIPIIPSIIALFLACSVKSYKHSYFSFYKYFVFTLSILDFLGILFFFIQLIYLKIFGKNLNFFDFDFNHYFLTMLFCGIFLLFLLFWKILLSIKFFEEITIYMKNGENGKDLEIAITDGIEENQKEDKIDKNINFNNKEKKIEEKDKKVEIKEKDKKVEIEKNDKKTDIEEKDKKVDIKENDKEEDVNERN